MRKLTAVQLETLAMTARPKGLIKSRVHSKRWPGLDLLEQHGLCARGFKTGRGKPWTYHVTPEGEAVLRASLGDGTLAEKVAEASRSELVELSRSENPRLRAAAERELVQRVR